MKNVNLNYNIIIYNVTIFSMLFSPVQLEPESHGTEPSRNIRLLTLSRMFSYFRRTATLPNYQVMSIIIC